MRRRLILLPVAAALAPLAPARADSQSSDSNTDCDGGRCRRTERFVIEDRFGRRGWVREQRWREDDDDRRGRRRDDDDDDRRRRDPVEDALRRLFR
jgi:hypothetical protein